MVLTAHGCHAALGLRQKAGEGTGRGGRAQFFGQPDFAGFAPRFNSFFKCFCHANTAFSATVGA
jgi:hypothetical protein